MCRRELFKAPYKADTVTKLRARLEAFDAYFEGNLLAMRHPRVMQLRDALWRFSLRTTIIPGELQMARIEALGRVGRFDSIIRTCHFNQMLKKATTPTSKTQDTSNSIERLSEAARQLRIEFDESSARAQRAVSDARARAIGELVSLLNGREHDVAQRERAAAAEERSLTEREHAVARREREVAERERSLRQ
ncbi:MAG: hypothetical protein Q9201_005715 [Fulgogasparrea decipioides]